MHSLINLAKESHGKSESTIQISLFAIPNPRISFLDEIP